MNLLINVLCMSQGAWLCVNYSQGQCDSYIAMIALF